MANVSEELARLAQLRDQGVLTDEEFQQQKAAVLRGEHPATPAANHPGTPKRKLGKGCLIVAVIVAVLIVIAAIAGGGNKATSTSSPAEADNAATPPVEVTANDLFEAYQANEAAAQQRYGNQPLMVTGTVSSIDLDITDDPVVQLKTSNQFMHTSAALADASKPRAAELSKGEKVRLLCASVGEVMGMPQLRECELQTSS